LSLATQDHTIHTPFLTYVQVRVGSFGHFIFKKRKLFTKKRNPRIIRSLFHSVLGIGQGGPPPWQFHPV